MQMLLRIGGRSIHNSASATMPPLSECCFGVRLRLDFLRVCVKKTPILLTNRLFFLNYVLIYRFAWENTCDFSNSVYICNVFFIVLDLRLTKVGVQRYSFFYILMSRPSIFDEAIPMNGLWPRYLHSIGMILMMFFRTKEQAVVPWRRVLAF